MIDLNDIDELNEKVQNYVDNIFQKKVTEISREHIQLLRIKQTSITELPREIFNSNSCPLHNINWIVIGYEVYNIISSSDKFIAIKYRNDKENILMCCGFYEDSGVMGNISVYYDPLYPQNEILAGVGDIHTPLDVFRIKLK